MLEQTLGHGAHARNLERALAEHTEIDATVIRLNFDSAGALRCLPGLGSWSLRASWTARSALQRRLAQGPLDAAFIHTQVAALLASDIMCDVPTVVSLDATPVNFDTEGEAYGHRRQVELLERLKRRVNRRALLRARALVTWCQWAKDSLVGDYCVPASRVTVIHPGVDQTLFRPAERRRPGPLRVLFVGGDFQRKGGTDMLKALEGLEGPFELDVATGAPLPGIASRPDIRVHTGLQPQSRALVNLYQQADVFTLPSRGDCFPQALAEAMACGLPVVAADVGAVSEMVRDGVNGYLVPARSPADLRRALWRLLNDPCLRRAMGQESRTVALRHHDARRNCSLIFDLMRSAAANVSPM